MTFKNLKLLAKYTVTGWSNDNASLLAAALSFYAFFSLAPLILIALSVAGAVLGTQETRFQIMQNLQGLIGVPGAQTIEQLVMRARPPAASAAATVFGVAALLVGASGVFLQLQAALNMIWKTHLQPRSGILNFIRQQALSFLMVLGMGFLLLASFVGTAALSAANTFVSDFIPEAYSFWRAADTISSFAIIAVFFVLIYKILPAVNIPWAVAAAGAVFSSILFGIGKYLVSLYLGRSGFTSTYGAAASLVVILFWIYYSAQILFLGAEFTKACMRVYYVRD